MLSRVELRRKLPQVAATLGACFGAFSLGTVIAWPSPATPELTSLNVNQIAQVAALMYLGAVIVPFFMDVSNRLLGKKWSMMLLTIPMQAGWLMIVLSNESPALLYIGRILTGFAGGAFVSAAPAYTAETAEQSIRGAMSTLMQLNLAVGVLFVYPVGCATSWQTLSWVCMVFPCILLIWMFFMPRTPTYLLSKGRVEEAKKSLIFLRGKEYDIAGEIKEIQNSLEVAKSQGDVSYLSLLSDRRYRRPFLYCMVAMFCMQFSGINFVGSYAVAIFKDTGSSLDPCVSSSLVVGTQVVGVIFTVFLVERFGRKPLLVFSSFCSFICLLGLGVYFYLKENTSMSEEDIEKIGFLPLVCLMVFEFVFNLGMGPLPWVLLVELLPQEARGKNISVNTALSWVFAYIVVYFGSSIEEALGPAVCYFIFGGVCLFGAIFTAVFVPETKGRSEEEMRKCFE